MQYSGILGPYAGGVIFSEEMDLDTLIDLTTISFIRNILFNLPLGSYIGCICAPRSQDKKILTLQYINYVRNNIDEDILIPDEGTEDMSELFYEIANIDEKYITNIIYTDYLSYSIGIAILLKFTLKGNFNVKIGILGSKPASTTLFSLLESLGSGDCSHAVMKFESYL
ncbi:glutamate dehydrogenase [Sulfurisphaera tokodaii str. 7]|uniref:Glutamate dehydrogenase n=1 Tax=Sulfurisphaera tokodaii (strain DSM 16993 / JCM 10545 / NBRC 100140 / 7) TaxID=273063 RepID=Q976U1_SULTO|nr:glutamate dehydrogenase [Sulfurisphaera tokodaii str. 7]